jgi:hypothetical protein
MIAGPMTQNIVMMAPDAIMHHMRALLYRDSKNLLIFFILVISVREAKLFISVYKGESWIYCSIPVIRSKAKAISAPK